MRTFSKTCVLLLGVALFRPTQSAEDKYPSAYPFDNELEMEGLIPTLPDSTPNYDFDESDPGGYTNLIQKCDYNQLDAKFGRNKWSPGLCPGARYLYDKFVFKVSTAGMSAADAEKTLSEDRNVNCSKFAITLGGTRNHADTIKAVVKKDTWTYMKTGFNKDGPTTEKWCTSHEDCCPSYLPLGFVRVPDSFTKTHQDYAVEKECKQGPTKLYMCDRLSWSKFFCSGTYLSPTKRAFVPLCPDHEMRYRADCKAETAGWSTKKTTADDGTLFEPALYRDKLTYQQFLATQALSLFPDKVCRPYSYYFPSFAKNATVSTKVTASSTVTSSKAAAAAVTSATPAASSAISSKEIIVVADKTSSGFQASAIFCFLALLML